MTVAPYQRSERFGLSPAQIRAIARAAGTAARGAQRAYNNYSRKPASAPRRKRRKKNGPARQSRPLQARVKKVESKCNLNIGECTRRVRNADSISLTPNRNVSTDIEYDINQFELGISKLQVFDPANPATPIVVDGRQGTFARRVDVVGLVHHLRFKNNHENAIRVQVYKYKCKRKTDVPPSRMIDQNAAAQIVHDGSTVVPASASNHTLVYPSDIPQLAQFWKQVGHSTRLIKPGGRWSLSHSEKHFCYDPSVLDDDTQDTSSVYSPIARSFVWLVRVEGDISYDTSDTVGKGGGTLDYTLDTIQKVQYEAGAPLKTLYIADNSLLWTGASHGVNTPAYSVYA